MMRISARSIVTTLAVAAVAVTVAAVPLILARTSDNDPLAAPDRPDGEAVIRTLATSFATEGSFRFGDATMAFASVNDPGPAVITDVAEAGALVATGDVLWSIGFEPTVLLYGNLPSYRDLEQGDSGPDVLQLELNLAALGFDPDGTVTIDDTFTSYTAAMVERWQESIDAEPTGIVRQGAVVYGPPERRVGQVDVEVGDSVADGQAILELTGRNRVVELTVDAANRSTVEPGDMLAAMLPDRTVVTVVVETMTIDESGGATVIARVDEPPDLDADLVPVDVDWDVQLVENAVVVPESSLIRADSGHYFLERVSDGAWVEVTPGAAADGWVEISGDVQPGDVFIAP